MGIKMIGAIDVGSNALRMKIGEIRENGKFKEIESVRKVISLGHDTFNDGKVSQKTINRVCKILKDFKQLLNEYCVEIYRVKATSAVREAENRDYFIEQVHQRTGIVIESIDNASEQFLTQKAVKYKVNHFNEMIDEGVIVVVIGAGGLQITMFKEGKMISSQSVKMGALRIKELLSSLEKETIKYHKLLDEFINVNLEGLDFFVNKEMCKHFVAVGGEISVIESIIHTAKTSEKDIDTVSRVCFKELYNKLRVMSIEEIMSTYHLKLERASIIVPSMMLFEKILSVGDFDYIMTCNVALTDGIVRDIYDDLYANNGNNSGVKDIISYSKILAKKFYYNENHNSFVEKTSLRIFDETKAIHGLSDSERLLLQVASILHDIGKYIRLDHHANYSYNIIKSVEIIGLSKEDMDIIANVCVYHGMAVPDKGQLNYSQLGTEGKLLVAKLSAIIKLADALDRSHNQKITLDTVRIKQDSINMKGIAKVNTKLEEWTFRIQSEFFEEVFGIKPVLKIRKEI